VLGEVAVLGPVLVLSLGLALLMSFVWEATKRSSLGVLPLGLALHSGPPLVCVVVVATDSLRFFLRQTSRQGLLSCGLSLNAETFW